MMFFCLLSSKEFLGPGVLWHMLAWSKLKLFSVESLFCFHLVYIVIIKKKSSATEISFHQKYNYCKKATAQR